MNMDTSASAMRTQTEVKVAELNEMCFHDWDKKNKTWTNSPSSPYTTTFGEGLIYRVYRRTPLYVCVRVGLTTWQVHFIGTAAATAAAAAAAAAPSDDSGDADDGTDGPPQLITKDDDDDSGDEGDTKPSAESSLRRSGRIKKASKKREESEAYLRGYYKPTELLLEPTDVSETDDDKFSDNTPLPTFARVRVVSVGPDGTLICSCCRQQSGGLFCEHICCVVKSVHEAVGSDWEGFPHHDIIARYQAIYIICNPFPTTFRSEIRPNLFSFRPKFYVTGKV